MHANLTLNYQGHTLKKITVNQRCRMIITCLNLSLQKLQTKIHIKILLILATKYFWTFNILSTNFFQRNGQLMRLINTSQYSSFFFHFCFSYFISFIGRPWLKIYQTKSILTVSIVWMKPYQIILNLLIKDSNIRVMSLLVSLKYGSTWSI